MADVKKKYYYAPTGNHSPNDPREIAPGNIIISPKHVWPPLLMASKRPVINTPVTKYGVELMRERERLGSFGMYAKFLEMLLGAGVDASVNVSKKGDLDYRFKEMTMEEFWPSNAYVRDRIGRPEVVDYLQGRLSDNRVVYMVIAVKHLTGAAAKSSKSSRSDLRLILALVSRRHPGSHYLLG